MVINTLAMMIDLIFHFQVWPAAWVLAMLYVRPREAGLSGVRAAIEQARTQMLPIA